MKSPVLAALVLILLAASSANAGEQVTLKDGVTGVANIIDTTPDSITVSFASEEATVTLKLSVAQLDPHSFYEIRRDYMEESAENHLRLALFCVDEGMFTRAQYHVDQAKALDAAYVKKVKAIPGLLDGVAEKVLAYARQAYDANDLETAERLAAAVLTRFPESPAAVQADALLLHLDEKEQAREAKRREEVLVAARKAAGQDEAAKSAEHAALLAPLLDRLELARKFRAKGLRERNNTRARKALEAAGVEYERILAMIAKLAEEHAEDSALVSALALGDIQIREDAVSCFLSAGSLLVARGSYAEAQKLARRALSVDSDSKEALSFQATVSLAAAMGSRGR